MTIVTAQKLAELLDCHPETLYRYCRIPESAGGIPRMRLGPQLRFDVDAVVGWMQARANGVESPHGSTSVEQGPTARHFPVKGAAGRQTIKEAT
jgi:hypothetical protein